VRLRLTPARTVMAGDGEDAQPITIDAVDAHGRHVPTANLMTRFTVQGARIIGVGNGDPNSHEPEKGGSRSLFNGLAQLIVQTDAAGRGRIVVRAEAEGLRPALLRIDRIAATLRPQAATVPMETTLAGWRRSPALAEPPAPTLAPADGDNNSWAFVRSGTATPPADPGEGRFRLYRTRLVPRRRVAAAGGTIRFASVAGRAQLWIDGVRVAVKDGAAPGPLVADLPAGGPHDVVLIVDAEPGSPSGIAGRVTVTAR